MLRTVFVGASLLCLAGCGANVFVTEVKGETTIQGDATGLAALLSVFPAIGSFTNIDFNQNQDFKNQGVSKDQVNSVKVDSIALKIQSPNDQTFEFLENLQFYARTGDQEVLIAEKTGINTLNLAAPNPVLMMDVKGAELQPFVTAPSMSITVRGKGTQPTRDTRLEATIKLRVEVKVF